MRIVRLGQKTDHGRTLLGIIEKEEAEGFDGGATNIVVHVGNGDVKQTLNGFVVTSA